MKASQRPRLVRFLLVLAVLALMAWLVSRQLAPMSTPLLCDALARARVSRLLAPDGVMLRCDGVRAEPVPAALAEALARGDAARVAARLRDEKGSALAVSPELQASAGGLWAKLAGLAHVETLRAVVLAPEVAVYVPARELVLSDAEREALAYVARAVFRGAHEPNLASFPAALRRVERVEVLVMLSRRGAPRLWRSARGTSIARALLTATRVARDRWREREQAMGGPLEERLLELDVDVSLLSEDGTLASTQSRFVDRAITAAHGVGFDHRTAWHYVLPQDVARTRGGPHEALLAQIGEQGLSPAILGESDTRVYRFVTVPLGSSKAPLEP